MQRRRVLCMAIAVGVLSVGSVLGETDLSACLQSSVRDTSGGKNPGVDSLEVTLVNKCGKDITSYALIFRDADSGTVLGGFRQELLDSLDAPPPAPDILRSGAKRVVAMGLPRADCTVSAAAAIFLDRSATGDKAEIAQLLASRAKGLRRFEARLSLLASVKDYNSALSLHRRALESSSVDGPDLTFYLRETLTRQFDRCHSSAEWDQFVDREQRRLRQTVANYEFHLKLLAPVSE